MTREGKSKRIQAGSAAAAGVQLVRIHRDTRTKAVRSLVSMSAPVCVCVFICCISRSSVSQCHLKSKMSCGADLPPLPCCH